MNRYTTISCKHKLLTLLCLVVLILPGCASQPQIFSDFDQRHDFSQDRTFTWLQDPPMLPAGDDVVSVLTESRMTSAIKGELIAKGYTFVKDQADADFSVLYTIGARDRLHISTYTNGTIAVDMFDVTSKQPIWHAKWSKHLSRKQRQSIGKNAEQIAFLLLKHFPVIGCKIETSKQCRPFDE